MNYQSIHDSIIRRGLIRPIDPSCYYEYHHITPRCEGGCDDGPVVPLTPKEHRIIHKLRYKLTGVMGNVFAYNLMKYGREALRIKHPLIARMGGRAHHATYKQRDPEGYSERQRKAGRIAGAQSRDNGLGFFRLTEEEKKSARDKGRATTVANNLGMFDPKYRIEHAKTLVKRVNTPSGVFNSMQEAAAYYNKVPGTITYRVQSSHPNWTDWFIIEGEVNE